MNTLKSQNKTIYSAYDVHITCNIDTPPGDDKTKQSFGQECDINHIMAKYAKTGIIESGNATSPTYGDASAFDFQQAQNIIIQAEQMFNALPALVRSKFDNDPHIMLSWMDNPENNAEATTMGLLPTLTVLPHTSTTSMPIVDPMPHQTATKGAGAPIPSL